MAADLTRQRASAAQLLTPGPADAVTWYFALEHDPNRTRLSTRLNAAGHPSAFVAVCQTGFDLFRPMVVLRGDDSAALRDALREVLIPRRQYLFTALPSARPDLEACCELHDPAIHIIYALHADAFKPVLNILVQTNQTSDGQIRAVIRGRDGSTAAESGTLWISSRYAEIFVSVHESLRGRGLGKSVVSAVTARVLQMGRTPLYVTRPDNLASVRLAQRLGYHDTGSLELSGALSLRT